MEFLDIGHFTRERFYRFPYNNFAKPKRTIGRQRIVSAIC